MVGRRWPEAGTVREARPVVAETGMARGGAAGHTRMVRGRHGTGGAAGGDGGQDGARRHGRPRRRLVQRDEVRLTGGGGRRGMRRLTGGGRRCSDGHVPAEAYQWWSIETSFVLVGG